MSTDVSRRKARVESVMILEPGSRIISARLESVEVTADGFQGDRHAGRTRRTGARNKDVPRGTEVRNDRQVTIVSVEELALVAQALSVPVIEPQWLGANLALSGLDELTAQPQGTRLVFPEGVVLWVEAENKPCTTPGDAIQAAYPDRKGLATAFPKVAIGFRGLLASVRRPGRIAVGDWVEVVPPG